MTSSLDAIDPAPTADAGPAPVTGLGLGLGLGLMGRALAGAQLAAGHPVTDRGAYPDLDTTAGRGGDSYAAMIEQFRAPVGAGR